MRHKTKYEVVEIKDENYVVLEEFDEKILVAKYVVGEPYIFYTKEYFFLDKYDCSYSYIDLESPPKINNIETAP